MAEFSGVSFGVLLSFAVTLSRFTGTLEQTGAIFSIINNICAFYSQNVCCEKYELEKTFRYSVCLQPVGCLLSAVVLLLLRYFVEDILIFDSNLRIYKVLLSRF